MPDDDDLTQRPTDASALSDKLSLAEPGIVAFDPEQLAHGEKILRGILDDRPGVIAESVTGNAVVASTGGDGAGVFGRSDTGAGLRGESIDAPGVLARSRHAQGLWADTTGDAPGVLGTSSLAQGVWGESVAVNRSGVAGVGNAGHGVVGETRSPHHAGVLGRGPDWAARFEGKVHILRDLLVDGDIVLTGADLAEQFTVVGEAAPGDVVVLGGADSVHRSDVPYDSRVAGVISGAGDYRPAIVLDRTGPGRHSLAMAGKVWVHVTADAAPVRVGDLLTTSGVPGLAMRAVDPTRSHGAVLGKALDALPEGRGLIRALVALH